MDAPAFCRSLPLRTILRIPRIPPARAREIRVLGVLSAGTFLFFNSYGSINVAIPNIQAEFGSSLSAVQWIRHHGTRAVLQPGPLPGAGRRHPGPQPALQGRGHALWRRFGAGRGFTYFPATGHLPSGHDRGPRHGHAHVVGHHGGGLAAGTDRLGAWVSCCRPRAWGGPPAPPSAASSIHLAGLGARCSSPTR